MSGPLDTFPDVGGYEVVDLVAQGRLGRVYRAVHLPTGGARALKILNLDADRQAIARRAAAAASSSRLGDHPHVVGVHDHGRTAQGEPYWAMDMLAGAVDGEQVARGRPPVAEAARIVRDAARGVAWAHGLGVSHGELGADAVLVDAKGQVRVAGLGAPAAGRRQGDVQALGEILELLLGDNQPPKEHGPILSGELESADDVVAILDRYLAADIPREPPRLGFLLAGAGAVVVPVLLLLLLTGKDEVRLPPLQSTDELVLEIDEPDPVQPVAVSERDEAIRRASAALELDPADSAARLARGEALMLAGHLEQALSDLEQLVRTNPRHLYAWYFCGLTYQLQGDDQRAIRAFTMVLQLDPNFAKAHCDRGVSYSRQGDLQRALAECERAIAVKPKFAPGWYQRGVVRLRLGKVDQARKDFERATQLDPGWARAWYGLARAKEGLGEVEGAIADLSRAIDLEPASRRYYELRARLYIRTGRDDLAERDQREARRR